MGRPVIGGKGSAHSASGIHAGSSVSNGAQVTQGYSHANGQGRRVAGVRFVGITGTEHHEDEQEAQEELNAQTLEFSDIGRKAGVTQAIVVVAIDEDLYGRGYI